MRFRGNYTTPFQFFIWDVTAFEAVQICTRMNDFKPELMDFYADDVDSSTRGVLLYQNIPQLISQAVANEVGIDTPINKSCSRFPRNINAPMKPTDPMYVFTKSSLVCKADTAADIANALLEASEAVFTRKFTMAANSQKCKIAIETPCGLCIKIKLFSLPEDASSFMVMFRKDSGDWFAFSSFFNSCVKFIASKGISFTQ